MDYRERMPDAEEAMRAAQDGHQARMWTSLPGIIESFDATKQVAVVQLAIQGLVKQTSGTIQPTNLPLLPDVPVEFPSGGGCTLTFPVQQGDECMVEFSARCIDAWWQSGGVQPPMSGRMHDLSDGICRVGVRSQARKLSAVSTASVQLRSDNGSTIIDLNPLSQAVTIIAPGGLILDANVKVNGTLVATGNVTAGSIDLEHHVHMNGGGTGNSGQPVG